MCVLIGQTGGTDVDVKRRVLLKQIGMWVLIAAAAPVTAAPRRIVCVGGALTEIVYALQAAQELVGVDTTSIYPALAKQLPKVGYARSLSVEGVLALAPTQVIVTEDSGPPAVLRRLRASGVPVAVLAGNHRFEGLLERVQRIGQLTARPMLAGKLIQQLRAQWENVQAHMTVPHPHKPLRVLFILTHSPSQIMVAGRHTSANAMIQYAGACNAISDFSGYKPLTPEAALAAQPDLILATEQGSAVYGGVKRLLELPGIAQTPAGRSRRVVALEAMFLLGFGPRLPLAVSTLNAAFTRSAAI